MLVQVLLIDWFKLPVALIWNNLEHISWTHAIQFSFYFLDEQRIPFFWPTTGGGWAKTSVSLTDCITSHRDLLYSGALRRPDFPDFLKGFLSSLHVCRQCFPLQIKYVSFAEIRVQYECVSEVQNYADTVSSYDRTMADTYPWGFVQSCTVIKV